MWETETLTQEETLDAKHRTGLDALHDVVARHLKPNQTDEDDNEGNIELVAHRVHLQVGLEALDLGIADVDAVN